MGGVSFTPNVSAGKRVGEKIIYWVIQWYVVSIVLTIPDLKLNSGQSMEVEIGDGRSLESLLPPPENRHYPALPFCLTRLPKKLPNPLAKICIRKWNSGQTGVLPKYPSLGTDKKGEE